MQFIAERDFASVDRSTIRKLVAIGVESLNLSARRVSFGRWRVVDGCAGRNRGNACLFFLSFSILFLNTTLLFLAFENVSSVSAMRWTYFCFAFSYEKKRFPGE